MGVKESQGEQSEDRADVEAGMGMSELVLPLRDAVSQKEKEGKMLISVSHRRQKSKTVCSSCEQSMGLKALLLPLLSET